MWEIATIFQHLTAGNEKIRKLYKATFSTPFPHQILEFYYSEKDLSGNFTFKKNSKN
jgi:hypothetical protein